MSLNKLSQVIEKYLEKTIDLNKALPEEEILLKHNIYPLIVSDRESSYLGSGESAIAFDVIYQGKNCVAKLTSNYKNVNTLLKLNEIKSQVGEYGKHIADVYKIIEYDEVINDTNYVGYIILMEKLEPLDKSVSKYLFGDNYFSSSDSSLKKLKETFDITVNLYKNPYIYFDNFKKLFESFQINIKNKDVYDLCKLFSKILIKYIELSFNKIILNNNNYRIYFSNVNMTITKNIYDNKKEFLSIFNNYNIPEHILLNFIISIVDMFLNKLSNGFAMSFDEFVSLDDFTKYKNVPELKSFIKFLMILNNKFNIKFNDLHSDNLMQRPGTKEVVIADAGYFNI